MANELKKRNEMDPGYQWDLRAIFPDHDAWLKAYDEADRAIAGIPAVQGTLGESCETLKAGLDTVYGAAEKMEKVYVFAMLQKSGDNGDPSYQEDEARAQSLAVRFSTYAAFLEPEILAIDPETLEEYRKSPLLATYAHMLDDAVRGRAHTLDAEREKMLAMLGDAAGGFSNTFDMFESVDMTFPSTHDEDGREVALTHGNFAAFRESRSQDVRRESFEKYFGEFKKYINTLAATYSGSVKMDCYYSDVRGFDSACERALFGRNVPVAVYDSLTEAVHEALPTMERYLALRRRVLGLDVLNMYDLYCPMVEDVEFKIPFEEAKELVKKATAPLGEEYRKLLDRAFSEHWIDVYENKGKSTGAFSCGVYGVHPYVLLNYTDTLDDAFTLAHELGHSMHSYFSDTTRDFVNHDYEITVAEVASTVNEVLLTKYLLEVETDKKRRAYILNHFLEGFRTTVFRQTLFAEFERIAHDMYKRGEPLTAQSLNAVYRKLNELYYKGAFVNELQDIEWARIPHFYRAFYVYQYATGFCSAVAIADAIKKTGDASRYLEFLATGGSDYPLEELKIAGVDLSDPATVKNAMRVFDESLSELEAIL